MVYITVKSVSVQKVQLDRRSASLVLKIMLFVRLCKYFFKVSEGPSFALHKETGEGGHKNYIVQHKRNMEHYHAPQSACVWEGGGDYCRG